MLVKKTISPERCGPLVGRFHSSLEVDEGQHVEDEGLQYLGEQEQEVDGQRAHERRHEEEEEEQQFDEAEG